MLGLLLLFIFDTGFGVTTLAALAFACVHLWDAVAAVVLLLRGKTPESLSQISRTLSPLLPLLLSLSALAL